MPPAGPRPPPTLGFRFWLTRDIGSEQPGSFEAAASVLRQRPAFSWAGPGPASWLQKQTGEQTACPGVSLLQTQPFLEPMDPEQIGHRGTRPGLCGVTRQPPRSHPPHPPWLFLFLFLQGRLLHELSHMLSHQRKVAGRWLWPDPVLKEGKATRATCSPDQPPLGAASRSPGSRAPDSEHLCPSTGRGHLRQCPCRPGSCSPSARALAPVPRLQIPRVGQRRGVIGPTKHAGQKGRGRAAASPTCRPRPRGPGLCRLTGPRREQP